MSGPSGIFAMNVRRLRRERKWSQLGLAEHSGISAATIGALEAGHHGVSLNTAVALAEALKGSLDEMTGLCAPGRPS